jgi:hypothetical protein
MNYVTNYYKNLSEQLQQRVQILSEALASYGNVNRNPYDDGMAPQTFNGALLGQMLGSGNVHGAQNYVNSFSGEYNGGSPAAYRMAPAASAPGRTRRPAGIDDSQGGFLPGDYNGDGRVDGADLGLGMGQGQNTTDVLRNWTPNGQQAFRSTTGRPTRGRGAVMGDAADSGAFGGDQGNQGGYDGALLGQLLGKGDMDAVNKYLSQFAGKPGNFSKNPRKRNAY